MRMRENRAGGRAALLIAALASAVFLAGCGTLPDAKPFADATGALSASAKASGQALTDSLREAATVLPDDRGAYERNIASFESSWNVRTRALQGAADYSNAIAGLISASDKSSEAAVNVAGLLSTLANSFGVPVAGAAASVATDIGSFVWQRISIVKASRSLEQAMIEAQPAVDAMAQQLVANGEQHLKPTLTAIHKNILSGIRARYDADANLAAAFDQRHKLLRQQALKDSRRLGELEQFEHVKTSLDARMAERDAKLEQAAATYRARLQLINALSVAVQSWAHAHSDLAVAVRKNARYPLSNLRRPRSSCAN
jgi:hypothetical protein